MAVEEVTVPRHQIRYGPLSVEKALGALPVIAELCRRLDICGIVDRAWWRPSGGVKASLA